jgi:hypothetical protein
VAADQVPVVFCICCNWSRNLAGFTGPQLYAAAQVTDENLEAALRKNLEMAAAYYASFYQVEALVAKPDTDDQQLRVIKSNRRHLAQCLIAEMKKRLGGLGLLIGKLEVSVVLPERLQREVEELWRLDTYNNRMPQLTQLRLARAMAQGRVTLNLIDHTTADGARNYTLGDYFSWPSVDAPGSESSSINGPVRSYPGEQ